MKSIKLLAKEVKDNMSNPRELGKILMYLSSMYAWYSEQLRPIKVQKAEAWLKIKKSSMASNGKLLSDRMTEMEWRTTPAGQLEQDLKYKLDGLSKLSEAIRQAGFLINQEVKNQT